MSRGISVRGLSDQEFSSRLGQGLFLFVTTSLPAVGWLHPASFADCETGHLSPSVAVSERPCFESGVAYYHVLIQFLEASSPVVVLKLIIAMSFHIFPFHFSNKYTFFSFLGSQTVYPE